MIDVYGKYSYSLPALIVKDGQILSKVVVILQSCNHTGNFFIYIIANSTIRQNFLQRFAKVKATVGVGRTTLSA